MITIWKDKSGKVWSITGEHTIHDKMKDSHLYFTILFCIKQAKAAAKYYNNMSDDQKIILAIKAAGTLNGEMAQASIEDQIHYPGQNDYHDSNYMGDPEVHWKDCLHPAFKSLLKEYKKRGLNPKIG